MRVLHIIHGLDRRLGGLPAALGGILRVERLNGVKSTVMSLFPTGENTIQEDCAEVCHLFQRSFPERFSRSKSALKWLSSHIQEYDLVVLHSVWYLLAMEAALLLSKNRTPFVFWPHGSLDPFDLQKKRLVKRIIGPILLRKLLQRAKAIICTSEQEAEEIETYGASANVLTVPLPVICNLGSGDRSWFRARFDFGEEDFVLLFLSRIDYKKGLNILIPALASLSDKYPKLKLAIAGSATRGYLEKVHHWVKEYAVSDKVLFCGFLDGHEKAAAFAGSDCFVLPSLNENFGIAIVEALGAGLPVLISKNVYIWKELMKTNAGWTCNYSIASLSAAVNYVIENREELQWKKKNATLVAQLFSPEYLAAQYKELYSSLLCG